MTWSDLISRALQMESARFYVALMLVFIVAVLWAVRPIVVAWIERQAKGTPGILPPAKPHPPPEAE